MFLNRSTSMNNTVGWRPSRHAVRNAVSTCSSIRLRFGRPVSASVCALRTRRACNAELARTAVTTRSKTNAHSTITDAARTTRSGVSVESVSANTAMGTTSPATTPISRPATGRAARCAPVS